MGDMFKGLDGLIKGVFLAGLVIGAAIVALVCWLI